MRRLCAGLERDRVDEPTFSLLVSVSEVYRQQSDLGAASDFIDRALFAFERAFVPAFNVSLGTARLDFGRVENRGFFLALTRDLQCVIRSPERCFTKLDPDDLPP